MNEIGALREKCIRFMTMGAILLAPFYYLRWYGDDFSRGVSLSLVDIFLFVLFGIVVYEERHHMMTRLRGNQLSSLGAIFVALLILGSLTGRVYASETYPFHFYSFLVALCQYGFVMVALPLIAERFFSMRVHTLIRWLAVGYLVPMMIGLVLLNHAIPEFIRSHFYSVHRAIGTYGNANGFANVIILMLPFYTYLASCDFGRWRIVGFLGQTLSIVSLVLTVSFSGWLGLLMLCVLAVYPLSQLVRSRHIEIKQIFLFFLKSFLWVLMTSCLVYFYAKTVTTDLSPRVDSAAIKLTEMVRTVVGPDVASAHVSESFDQVPATSDQVPVTSHGEVGSAIQRMQLIRMGFHEIRHYGGNIVWGVGLGNSVYSSNFKFFGVQLDIHNTYMLLWLECGLLSAIAFFCYFWTGARTLFLDNSSLERIPAALACFMFLFIALVNPHLYLRYLWVPLFPIFAMYGRCSKKST
ncbi:hypothetical protein [Paludibacterium sp. THUN1379]|uniref:hypothetical protein n=1 Tax=Paludibacterium sp. THUN1379 TaxID=3112107 RepID=UPI0030CAF8C4